MFKETLISLAKDSVAYILGAAMLGVGNLVLVPFYTRQLQPSEFGVLVLIEISIVFLVAATQIGLPVAYLRWYAASDSQNKDKLLSSAGILSILAALIGGILLTLYAISPWNTNWTAIGGKAITWTLLPLIVLENTQTLLLTNLRARQLATRYSSILVIRLFVIVGITVWLVSTRHLGVLGVLLGRMFGDCIAVTLLVVLNAPLKINIDFALTRAMARYGIPVMLASISAMLLDMSGRYFLGYFGTLAEVGYYGAAIKISGIFQMLLVQPFGIAWGGVMFQIAKRSDAQLIYKKIFTYVLLLGILATVSMSLASPMVFHFFATQSYEAGLYILPIILLVRATGALVYPASIGIYLSGKTTLLVPIFISSLAANSILNFYFIPIYGMTAAAWIWLITSMMNIVLMLFVGQKYYPLNYDIKLIVLALTVLSICIWGYIEHLDSLVTLHWSIQLILATTIAIIACVIIYVDLNKTQEHFRGNKVQHNEELARIRPQ